MEKYINSILPKIFFTLAFCLCAYSLYYAIMPTVFLPASRYMKISIIAAVFAFCGFFLDSLGAGAGHKEKSMKIIMSLFFAYYVVILVCLTLFNGYSDRLSHFSLNSHFIKHKLMPFETFIYFKQIGGLIHGYNFLMSNLLGNLFSFMPLAWFMPFFLKKTRKTAVFVLLILITVILLETAQSFFCLGEFDTDDIILNFTGALSAYLVIMKTPVSKLLPK